MRVNGSELKATLTDFANALYEAGEEANSDLVFEALDYIEELEDDIEELNREYDFEEPCDPLAHFEVWGDIGE